MERTSQINGIPVYAATVDAADEGMIRISLVDSPAVMSDFQHFASQRQPMKYAVQDEDRHLVYGVIMRADFPIYRRDGEGREYYLVYSAETIRKMAERYLAQSRQNRVDLMHDGNEVQGVQMVQWFIKDKGRGISPEGFSDIADGSLFAEFHITDPDIWAQVKDGTYRGFSLEGLFGIEPEHDQQGVDEMVDALDGAFSRLFNHLKDNKDMARISKIKAAIVKVLQSMGSVTTDKGIVSWDGEDDLSAGMDVYTEDSDGNRTKAADGDYTTRDGKVIRVADGKVSEITDDKAEVEASRIRKAVEAKIEAFEMSYDEKTRLIYDALRNKLGTDYFYIVEAADGYVITENYDESYENRSYMRYPVEWNGDEPTIGDAKEVRPAFIPKDMEVTFSSLKAERDNAVSEKKRLEDENKALKAEVEKFRSQPAAHPAHEEYNGGGKTSTGNRGLDRLAKIMGA